MGMLLLGTTDTAYEGDPSAAHITDEDVEAVLAEASIGLPPGLATPAIRERIAALATAPAF